MHEKILQGFLVAWMVGVLAVQWIAGGGPGFVTVAEHVRVLGTARALLSAWFFQPYGS